jgi:hypothetical protein
MTEPNIYCVLTPPRSGSSLTTNILNALGVNLGEPELLAEGSIHNPRGYWEHKAILAINNEILSRLGYSYSAAGADWNIPPVFPSGWEKDRRLDDLKERARSKILNGFGEHELWGWKDPRTCFTLPFWQDILPPMRYIICIRNPVDVAHSKQRFMNCSFDRALYLWLLYLKYAFQYTDGQDRLLIKTQVWTENWAGELDRISRFMGKPELVEDAGVLKEVHKLIDRNLWHHGASSQLLSMVLEVYKDLIAGIQDNETGRTVSLQTILDQTAPEFMQIDEDEKRQGRLRWQSQLRLARDEMTGLIPQGNQLILVDDNQIGTDFITGRTVTPFLERDGQYWGRPPDSSTAIQEFDRLQCNGADYLVFVWPAFWWLEYFTAFDAYLRSKYRCVLHNERLVVFDLKG